MLLVGLLLSTGFAGSAKINLVDAAKSVVNGCILLVSFIRPAAGFASVIWVLCQSVGPTIIECIVVAPRL